MSHQSEVEYLRERVSKLEAALNQKLNRMQVVFNITPSHADLLGLLVSQPHITMTMVEDQIGIFTNLKVAICRLRKVLATHEIEIHSRRFNGYWLDKKDQTYIRDLVAEETSAAA